METNPEMITIPVKLDEKTFRRFAYFDMFILRKKWIRPVVFFLIMTAFALAALLIGKEQSGMIAAVLLMVGLKPARYVYTVTLGGEGVTAKDNGKNEETPVIPWEKIQKAFRRKGCIYLYVTAAKAFLIPAGQADAPDHEVWVFIQDHLGADKCKG